MIIGNFHIARSASFPYEADAPLVVDANTVLPRSPSRQFLKAIPRRYAHVRQRRCRIQHPEFAHRASVDGRRKPRRTFAFKHIFRAAITETSEHTAIITPPVTTVKVLFAIKLFYSTTMKKKLAQSECCICKRIQLITQDKNPYFVAELKTGYVVMGDYQFFRGYTVFLCKEHKSELHELSPAFRNQHLWETSQVAEAVYRAFHPRKLNYELLGNTDAHIHWHIFPRHADDPLPQRTVWSIPQKIRQADSARPSSASLQQLKRLLKQSLSLVLKKSHASFLHSSECRNDDTVVQRV